MADITITVSGPVGSGKSALLGEIEVLMRALGVPVRYADPMSAESEKRMTGADWTAYIEMYQPSVVLVEAPPAAPEPSANERRLRRLLCIVKHGRSAYMDDGEAQDSSAHPSIDYLRDSLDEIEAKWRLRASATLTAPEPSEAEVAAAMASLHRAMEPAAWPSEDEITDALRAAAAARNTNPA
ncbi:MAG: hypothetical protein KA200_01925 [Burkholderiales bacterium]|nr:hypothetical protein [Burkholderiales bacterium]